MDVGPRGRPVVGGFRGGVVVVAKTTNKVNTSAAHHVMSRNNGMIVTSCSERGTSRFTTRLDGSNTSMHPICFSTARLGDYGRLVAFAVGRCKRVSMLMGGMKNAGPEQSAGVRGLSVSCFSRTFRLGLSYAVCLSRLIVPVVDTRNNKGVIGMTSVDKVATSSGNALCNTDGTKIVGLAGCVTARAKGGGVHYGTMTPKLVLAPTTLGGLGRRMHGVFLKRYTAPCLNRPRSITTAVTFLTSRSTHCVAKRAVMMSNKLAVRGPAVGLMWGRSCRIARIVSGSEVTCGSQWYVHHFQRECFWSRVVRQVLFWRGILLLSEDRRV